MAVVVVFVDGRGWYARRVSGVEAEWEDGTGWKSWMRAMERTVQPRETDWGLGVK